MADRIVVMHDGIVEQIGTPLELYDRPANLFVAGFIGSPAMNMLDGNVEKDRFVTDGASIPDADGNARFPREHRQARLSPRTSEARSCR